MKTLVWVDVPKELLAERSNMSAAQGGRGGPSELNIKSMLLSLLLLFSDLSSEPLNGIQRCHQHRNEKDLLPGWLASYM